MGKHLSLDHFGARPGWSYTGGSITSGQARLTVPGAQFAASDVGSVICVPGALGSTVNPLVTTITAIVSDTQVDLDDPATATLTGTAAGAYGPDCYDAFIEALANCRKRNRGALLIPSGLWLINGGYIPLVSDIDIYGRGRSSIIYAANTVSALYAQGRERVSIRGISFRSHAAERSSLSTTAAVWLRECAQVEVADVFIDGSASAGIFADLSDSVHVRSVEVRNTKADGVHIVGCTEAIVDGVRGRNTGDDTVSVVSYASQTQAEKVAISNVVSINSRTRAVVVGGSANVVVSNCVAINPGAHGYLVAYESGGANPAAELHTPYNITFHGCRISGALGTLGPPEGYNAILIAGDATHMVDDVTIANCVVEGSNQCKIAFATNVRIMGTTVRNSRFSGVIIEDCEDVDFLANKLKDVEGIGVSYVRVADGQISGNRLTDCQTLNEFGTGASSGRIHIIESTDVYGFGNRDKRASTYSAIASYGAILVSGGARVMVGVTEIDTDAADSADQVRGFEVQSLRDGADYLDQVFIGTRRPVNPERYAMSLDRGVYIHDGDFQMDGAASALLGSGGSASLELSSGFPRLSGEGGMEIEFDRSGSNPGASITIKRDGAVMLAIDSSGDAYLLGKLHLGNLSTSWISAGSGSPEGVRTAAPGSLYLDVSGAADRMAWIKTTGSGNTGWSYVTITPQLPGDGVTDNILHLTGTSPTRTYSFKALDLAKAASVQITGTTGRFLRRKSDGSLECELVGLDNPNAVYAPGGLGDFLVNDGANAVSFLTGASVASLVAVELGYYATIADLQDQIDALTTALAGKSDVGHGHSGTTGGASAGTAHTHGWST